MISLKNQLYVPALLSLFIPLNLANASEYVHKVSAHLLQQSDGYLVNRVFTGRVSAMDASNIGFDFGGKVVNIYADLGDRVSKGDLLATQDTIMLSNARRELNAQLTELDAQIALNQANLRRVNALKSKGYASNQQLDELNSQRDVLLASRARILAGLASNQTQLDKAQLLAPYDAIITAKHIGVGNVVAGGSPVFSLDQQGVKQATIGVSPHLSTTLVLGDSYELAYGNARYQATVAGISPSLDERSRTVPVRFEIKKSKGLYAGSLVSLLLSEHHSNAGFWVPTTALTEGPRGAWNVLSIQPKDSQWVLQAKTIRVLHATANQAYVQGNLNNGEKILAAGTHRFVAGQTVRFDDQNTANSPAIH